jgi:hypothetical protein
MKNTTIGPIAIGVRNGVAGIVIAGISAAAIGNRIIAARPSSVADWFTV